jgi:beta-galactosidase
VSYWNGLAWIPVTGQRVSYASSSDQPTTITFHPVGGTAVRLDMTSRSAHDPITGNLTIAEIRIPGNEVVARR